MALPIVPYQSMQAEQLSAASRYLWELAKISPLIGPSKRTLWLTDRLADLPPVAKGIMGISSLNADSLQKFRQVVDQLNGYVGRLRTALTGWEGNLLHHFAVAQVDQLERAAVIAQTTASQLSLGATAQEIGAAMVYADKLHWRLERYSLRAIVAMGSHYYEEPQRLGVHTIPALEHYFVEKLARLRTEARLTEVSGRHTDLLQAQRISGRNRLSIAVAAGVLLAGAALWLGLYLGNRKSRN